MSGFVGPGAPSQANFLLFIRGQMGIPTNALPDNSGAITNALTVALQIVNQVIAMVNPTIYALAVYNLAGDYLIRFALDQPGMTYFQTLRGPAPAGYNLANFAPGAVQSASDVSTSSSLVVPDWYRDLTLANQLLLQTPYGRQYLAFAQSVGTLWGLT